MSSSTSNVYSVNSTNNDNNKNREDTPGINLLEPEEILPYFLTCLTPDMIKEAETHLHETEENRTRCLREFRNFIQNQKNLVTPTSDLYLLSFLRARKYDSERTYKLFLNFWKFRKDNRAYFDNINVEALLAVLSRNIIGYLEYRDNNGAFVGVLKFGQWKPDLDSLETTYMAITALLTIALEYDANQIVGLRLIYDFRGFSWTQMKHFTPSMISLYLNSFQFCFPARYKGFHVITDSRFFKIIWTLAYPMLTKKLKERIFLHGSDLKPIQKYIHPSVLPVDFGGDAPAFETTKWNNYYNERMGRLLEFFRCGYKDS